MGSTNASGTGGLFQPIWKASPSRRNAAIIALVGMVIITLAAFLPAYGKTGDAVTDVAVSAINALGSALGVDLGLSTSFTLFEACQTNLVLLILLEIAIALGFIFPILTETELELIPAVLLAGIHIYVCLNAGSIYMASYSSNLTGAGEVSDASIAVSILTPGFLLGMAGLAVMIVGIVLHLVKGNAAQPSGSRSRRAKSGQSAGAYAAEGDAYSETDKTSAIYPGAGNAAGVGTYVNPGENRSSSGRDTYAEDYTMPVGGYRSGAGASEEDLTVPVGGFSAGVSAAGEDYTMPIGGGSYTSAGSAAYAAETASSVKSTASADDITYPTGAGSYASYNGVGAGNAAGGYADNSSYAYRGSNMYQSNSNPYTYRPKSMEDLYSGDPDAETNILDGGTAPSFQGQGNANPVHDDRTEALHMPPQHQPVASLKRLNTGELLVIYEGDSILGRSRNRAQLIVNSAAVSGAHARISAYRSGCAVTDIGSTNGTYINGEKIYPNVRSELKDGDYLSLGAEILEFHLM